MLSREAVKLLHMHLPCADLCTGIQAVKTQKFSLIIIIDRIVYVVMFTSISRL